MIWLDIISSITTGRASYLLSQHPGIMASNVQTKLEHIMGCLDWVMLQIGRISALHEHKTQALQQEQFGCTGFEQTVEDISREFPCDLTQVALEGFDLSELDSAAPVNKLSDPSTLITHMFAHMAFIYLHVVTRGFQELELLEATIAETMMLLQAHIPIHLLSAMVSMSVMPLLPVDHVFPTTAHEQFFRNIFSSPPLLNPILKHRERVLPILEEI
jgi:hypothetical protein